MRKLVIGILMFNALAVWAHPKDYDPATAIDEGTIITILKELNIPNHNKILFLEGDEYRFYSQVKSGPFCAISAFDNNKKELGRDARIQALTEVTIEEIISNGRLVSFLAKTLKNNYIKISCYKEMIGGKGTVVPTIGEVKQALAGIIDIKFADSIDL